MVELTDDDEDDSALDVAQVRRALLRTAVAAPLLGLLHVGLVESFSAYAVVRSTCRVLPLLPLALAERPVSGCRTAGRELAVLAAWSGLVVWCLGSDVLGDYVWNVLYSGSPTLAARQTAKDAAGLIEPWLNMPPLVMVLSLAAMGTPLAVAFSARVARLSLRWQWAMPCWRRWSSAGSPCRSGWRTGCSFARGGTRPT